MDEKSPLKKGDILPETLIKIRDHAVNKKAEVDWSQVEDLVQFYRK
jgi:hypothetical protein